jgi:hypothetical protein
MPGWESLETVAAVHSALALAGLVLVAMLIALAALAAWQLRSGQWPEWLVSSTDQRNTYLKPRTWSDGDEEVSLGWVYSSSERGALGALEEG